MIPVFSSLLAFVLPCIVLYRYSKDRPLKRAYLYSVGSFAAALTAVCLEVHTVLLRCEAGDFGGIADTIGAVHLICIGISAVTVLLNTLAMAAIHSDRT